MLYRKVLLVLEWLSYFSFLMKNISFESFLVIPILSSFKSALIASLMSLSSYFTPLTCSAYSLVALISSSSSYSRLCVLKTSRRSSISPLYDIGMIPVERAYFASSVSLVNSMALRSKQVLKTIVSIRSSILFFTL